MIERPKRSVTRFFVPLIDVLILLFCIFLLMPFFGQPVETPEPPNQPKMKEEPLPKDVQTLQHELQLARKDAKELEAFRSHLADRLNVMVIFADPNTGALSYFRDRVKTEIPDQRTAEDVIDRHKRQSGNKEPFFLILLPIAGSGAGAPSREKINEYRSWFKGVQFRMDRP
jgi:hypothetical protein